MMVERTSGPWLGPFRAELKPGMRTLDLGCGWGHDAAELLSYGLRVVGIDKDAGNIERSRERAPEAEFIVADMREGLPFHRESFDVVCAGLCLHYFDEAMTKAILRDISRVLKPGGLLICRVNRVGDLNFEYGKGRELEPEFFEVRPGHTKRYFTEESLCTILESVFMVELIESGTTKRWGREKLMLIAKARRPSQ